VAARTDIRLVEASSEEDTERVRLMLQPEEIWRALTYDSWPDREQWRLPFDRGQRAAFLVEHVAGTTIGFLISGLSRFRDWGYVDLTVAITEREFRRKGYGWRTIGLAMDVWFARGASVCWACYSRDNLGTAGMARRIHAPEMSGGPRRLQFADGERDAASVGFTRAQWEYTKQKIGWV